MEQINDLTPPCPATQRHAGVAVDVPLVGLFDYLLPPQMTVTLGQRVRVSFGHRTVIGIVMALGEAPAAPARMLKPLAAVLDDMPPLSAATLALLRFCADYYQHPIGPTVHTALPGLFRAAALVEIPPRLAYRAIDSAALLQALPARASLQRKLAQLLAAPCAEAPIRALSAGAWKLLQTWIAEGRVIAEEAPDAVVASPPAASSTSPWPHPSPTLNAEQTAAVTAVRQAQGFAPFLLHGLTGSGKTEVYLQAIAEVLARGLQALVLVPEINLTPQLESRFRQRFAGVEIAALHSAVSERERATGWLRAARGEVRIVLGTRLAVFTPLPALGLIVVDEEHDASFKQQDGLRYSARDVAVYRARQANIPIVLGSATPALESWHNARTGRYRLLQLTARAVHGAQPPTIRLIPTRNQVLNDGLHPQTLQAITTRLGRGEQVLVFLNRRGYAPVIHCGECGWMAACTRCSARMTLHLAAKRLRCHHCGLESRLPPRCPACGNIDLRPIGQGTQRLEETLTRQFASARILRLDRDSTRRKGSFKAAINTVHRGEVDILVGTQMLAKGHDFPNLTLVLVLGADSGLYAADFRASERLFSQLSQVAGRAGRAEKPGEVLIQTDFPDHPLFSSLIQQDFAAFAELALAERRLAGFPPYCSQAVLRAEAPDLAAALAFLAHAATLAPPVDGVTVYDPVAASMVRLADRERAQLLVQAERRPALQTVLTAWISALRQLRPNPQVRWSLDVDPLAL